MKITKTQKHLLLITTLYLIFTFVIYLPFLFRADKIFGVEFNKVGMEAVFGYFDGPWYLVVAKTFYNPSHPLLKTFTLRPPIYFANHLPLYPLFIRVFATFFNYPTAMLFATHIFSLLFLFLLYFFLRNFQSSQNPLSLTVAAIFLPARWVIYHSVGASEPLFLLTLLASFYFFKKSKYWKASFTAALATLTRTPGILLFPTFIILIALETWTNPRLKELALLRKLKELNWPAIFSTFLIPLSLIGVFVFYYFRYNTFWAYSSMGGGLSHLESHLFESIFRFGHWGELNFYIYLINAIGLIFLYERGYLDLFVFSLIYFIPTLFINHHDISRFILPIFPFTNLIAFRKLIESNYFKIALILMLPAILVYTWGTILENFLPTEFYKLLVEALRS